MAQFLMNFLLPKVKLARQHNTLHAQLEQTYFALTFKVFFWATLSSVDVAHLLISGMIELAAAEFVIEEVPPLKRPRRAKNIHYVRSHDDANSASSLSRHSRVHVD